MSAQPNALRLADMQRIDAYACRTLAEQCLRSQHELISDMREILEEIIEHHGKEGGFYRARRAIERAKEMM